MPVEARVGYDVQMWRIRALFVGACCLVPYPALASPPPQRDRTAEARHALSNTNTRFLGIEFLGVASFNALNLLTRSTAESCGWCRTISFDRSVRNALRASDPEQAGAASHVLARGVAGALALTSVALPPLLSEHDADLLANGVMLVNSSLLTLGISELIKDVVARQRPAFHYGVESQTEANDEPEERYRSFISGDTAWVFSLTSSATTISYLRGYPSAPYVLAGGSALAVTTGALRIAGDMHWATDVLAGALVGTASGMLLPLAFHRREATGSAFLLLPEVSMGRVGLKLIVTTL